MEITKIKDIFDSILCLCIEGVEFMSRTELASVVIEEATKGYKLCEDATQSTIEPNAKKLCDHRYRAWHKDGKCPKCGD